MFKNRFTILLICIAFDIAAAVASVFLAGSFCQIGFNGAFFTLAAVFAVSLFVFLYIFKAYNILWKYAGYSDYIRLVISACLSGLVMLFASLIFETDNGIKIGFSLISVLFVIVFIFCFRLAARHSVGEIFKGSTKAVENIMIIGAGDAAKLLIDDIQSNRELYKSTIKCAIDDNTHKIGNYISGVKIVGDCNSIPDCIKEYHIDTIIFAIPSCKSARKSEILQMCQKTGCKIRVLPSVYKMLSGQQIKINTLREVQIEDLLGRDPIDLTLPNVFDYIKNKTVLVTGGGGSIGSELCRQIAFHNPKKLIIFDIYENNAYEIQNELKFADPELDLITLIGSVRDKKRLESVFEKYKPQLVFHAAAHKHVPLMEDSPNEAIKNNVFGTYNTALCADKYGAEKFVLISTDKAVNPTNIMGASKRICEMIVQSVNEKSKTEFVAVRFGNVLGSNGSVIPLFKKQIEKGGPVTVTDPNMIRYFMTIPEAVSLVIQAGSSAKGGEIFVLDMGKPVKIVDLAENLIRLSGYKPYSEIQIEFIGLRPGEKMYEELLMSEEGLKKTDNRLIYIGHAIDFDENEFFNELKELKHLLEDENSDIREITARIVPTYHYNAAQ